MNEIKILISKTEYEKIESMVTWLNVRNELSGSGASNYSIEDFVKGATLDKLEEFESMKPLSTPISTKIKIKNNFKSIAKEKNIRQVDICNILEIDKAYLSMIFNNRAQPGLEAFFRIWALLGCPPMSKTIYFVD